MTILRFMNLVSILCVISTCAMGAPAPATDKLTKPSLVEQTSRLSTSSGLTSLGGIGDTSAFVRASAIKSNIEATSQRIKGATVGFHIGITIGKTLGSAAISPELGKAVKSIVRGLRRFVARDLSLEEKVTSLIRDIGPTVRSLFSRDGIEGLSRSFVDNVLSRLDEIERIAVDIRDLAGSVGDLGGWGLPDVIELGTLCVEEGGLVAELASMVAVIAV